MNWAVQQRRGWSDNGHIKVDWSRVKIGDVIDHVDVEVQACPVRFGDPHWNVLVVNPHGEANTVDRLLDASIRTYWPKVFKWEPTKELLANGQRKMTKMPKSMFPGYLFVDRRRGLDNFSAPLGVKGVRDYLWREAVDRHGRPTREPCVLPNALYEAIVDREGERSRKVDEDKRQPFKAGQTVRITDGPFRDTVAKVESSDDRGRVAVLLEIFARPTPTTVNVDQLERV